MLCEMICYPGNEYMSNSSKQMFTSALQNRCSKSIRKSLEKMASSVCKCLALFLGQDGCL